MGLITDEIRQTASAALDSLMAPVEDGGLGKHCRLIFDPVKTKCPNCGWDASNTRSNSRYKTGGPQPFPKGTLCPVCSGLGTLNTEVTKDIVFLLNWTPKLYAGMAGIDPSNANLQVPGGVIGAKGFLTSLPDVLQSRKMVVETPIEGVARYVYELAGEPIDQSNIIQGRYFTSMWKRFGT